MRHAGTVRSWARVSAPVVAGYLLGSIPTAVIVASRRRVDPREVGDHNPGWWNTRAELGARAALPVLLVDVTKGVAAAAIGRAVARPGEWWPGYAGAAAAMVGHAWPVFAGFRGGRSVATFGGAAAVLSPASAMLAAAGGALTGGIARSAAIGIRTGFVAYPVVQLTVDGPDRTAATGGLMSLVGFRFWQASRR
jgi:acyl phosphate:glycerol-3-phosphate acyltransferase